MNPAYFETRFTSETELEEWPDSFAIITGYATTGERWTHEQNHAADERLARILKSRDALIGRLTGYSPSTGHEEPGWATSLEAKDAIEVGRNFRQDAIYYIVGDTLFVTHCERLQLIEVGPFRERLT